MRSAVSRDRISEASSPASPRMPTMGTSITTRSPEPVAGGALSSSIHWIRGTEIITRSPVRVDRLVAAWPAPMLAISRIASICRG